ncbi:MAG: endo-1,4-beta-xylanase, partial [Clostridium sp.]|nr:endo-1,4-beta-xylanase [Clostridium sp.]
VYHDESFIINAFKYANQYAPAHIKLFYNDYNETAVSKVKDIVTLIEAVKAQEGEPGVGTRIDGMGMQGHYGIDSPTPELFKEAAIAYQQALGEGGEIQLTELDMGATIGFDGANDPVLMKEENDKQSWHYAELYNAIREMVADGSANFTNIIFWGTHDSISWLKSQNSVGGSGTGAPVFPLPFDDDMQAKPAYWAFVNQQKLSPVIKPVTVVRSDEVDYNVALPHEFGKVTFLPLWNDQGLYVKVKVNDLVTNEDDSISLYVDHGTLWSQTVVRSNENAVAGGYEYDFHVEIPNLEVLSTFRIDVSLYNEGLVTSFNDTTNNQSLGSNNYALATCKPFALIHKGTPTIDGLDEDVWANVPSLPFTIVTEAPDKTTQASAKLLWDEENLYVLATVVDAQLNKTGAGGGVHLQDSVEVFIDEYNHKSDGYRPYDSQYRINYDNEATFNGENANAQHLKSVTVKTEDGYVVEAAFKWIKREVEVGNKVGLELQINDAKGGNRIGCLSWYDTSGSGWSSPKVFGTAMLAEALEGTAQEPSVAPSEPEPQESAEAQESTETQVQGTDAAAIQDNKGESLSPIVVVIAAGVVCVAAGVVVVILRKKKRK